MPEQKFDRNQRMDWLKTQCEIYEHGKAIYNIIAQNLQETPGTEAIVSPANLGDTVFIGTLAKEYKKVIADLTELYSLLGHSRLETTWIYTETTMDEKRARLEMLAL